MHNDSRLLFTPLSLLYLRAQENRQTRAKLRLVENTTVNLRSYLLNWMWLGKTPHVTGLDFNKFLLRSIGFPSNNHQHDRVWCLTLRSMIFSSIKSHLASVLALTRNRTVRKPCVYTRTFTDRYPVSRRACSSIRKACMKYVDDVSV